MKKVLTATVVFLVALILIFPSTAFARSKGGFSDAGGDYGNTWPDAYLLEYSHVSGSLTAGDVDFFKYVPEYTASYTFQTTGATNTQARFYDQALVLLSHDHDDGAGRNFSITYKLVSGRIYYLAVSGQYASTSGDYKLKITCNAERGNSAGNIVNGANACIKGSTIYYSNSDKGFKLYKVKTDGSGKKKLSDDPCRDINVVGDYVYYTNTADGNKLYRVKKSGSCRQRLTDYFVTNVIVISDWVYYLRDDNKAYKLRIKTAGSEPPYKLTDCRAAFLNVYDDSLYFMNKDDGNSIYTCNLNGGELWDVNGEQSFFIIAANRWLYFEGLDAGSRVYCEDLTGVGRYRVNNNNSLNINYSGGWIYFVNEDNGNRLYKIRTNGTGKKKLTNIRCAGFSVVGNWIYYYNDTADKYYRVKKDGTGNKLVK